MKIENIKGFYNQIFKKNEPVQPRSAGLKSLRFADYYFLLQFFKLKTAIMK